MSFEPFNLLLVEDHVSGLCTSQQLKPRTLGPRDIAGNLTFCTLLCTSWKTWLLERPTPMALVCFAKLVSVMLTSNSGSPIHLQHMESLKQPGGKWKPILERKVFTNILLTLLKRCSMLGLSPALPRLALQTPRKIPVNLTNRYCPRPTGEMQHYKKRNSTIMSPLLPRFAPGVAVVSIDFSGGVS